MAFKRYWKRTGHISIEGGDGRMYSFGGDDGLDFKFSGEKIGDYFFEFNCGILGLSADSINELTVWNPAEATMPDRKRRIEVYAGYDSQGEDSPIFSGIVMNAIPTSPPEMWLNFNCMFIGSTDMLVANPRMMENERLVDIMSGIANEIGYGKVSWGAGEELAEKRVDFEIVGPIKTLAQRFGRQFGLLLYGEDNILKCIRTRPQLYTPENPRLINTENGMLGIGKIDIVGARVRTRLDDSSKLFGWIELESQLMPRANGMYCIMGKKHVGHFRGNEWYTELDTYRKGARA